MNLFSRGNQNDNALTPLINKEQDFKSALTDIFEIDVNELENWKVTINSCGIIRWACIFHSELFANCKWIEDIILKLKQYSNLKNNSKLNIVALKTLNEMFSVSGMKKELDLYAHWVVSCAIKSGCSNNVLIQEEGERFLINLFSKYSKSRILNRVYEDYLKDKFREP